MTPADLAAIVAEAQRLLDAPRPCATCNGSGYAERSLALGWTKEERCSACGGSGRAAVDPAPDLARTVIALAERLTAAEADAASARQMMALADVERDAAVAAHAALAAAVRTERECESALTEALAATNRTPTRPGERVERYEAFCAAEREHVAAHKRTDALLRGAPAGYVRADVVAEYREAVEEHRRAGVMPSCDHPARARLRAATTALDAALAAAGVTR